MLYRCPEDILYSIFNIIKINRLTTVFLQVVCTNTPDSLILWILAGGCDMNDWSTMVAMLNDTIFNIAHVHK